ncbi:MAG: hypothetical protein WC761_03455, partial [Candidatus Paceibacterota bacterium]
FGLKNGELVEDKEIENYVATLHKIIDSGNAHRLQQVENLFTEALALPLVKNALQREGASLEALENPKIFLDDFGKQKIIISPDVWKVIFLNRSDVQHREWHKFEKMLPGLEVEFKESVQRLLDDPNHPLSEDMLSP